MRPTAGRRSDRLGLRRATASVLLGAALLAAVPAPAFAHAGAAASAATTEWRLCMYLGGHPTLKKGDTSEAVRHLQCILSEVYRYQTVTANGVFEDITDVSVRHLQQQFGIPVTGVVDATTWTVLHP